MTGNYILKVKKLREDAVIPSYAHPGDAGMDIFSAEEIDVPPGESRLIHTGIAIELPPSTEAQIRPRSGLALTNKVTVLNSPGTIDEGYRGEVCVIIINHSHDIFHVKKRMKIAQMVIQPVLTVSIIESPTLSDSQRGTGGFGSTGI